MFHRTFHHPSYIFKFRGMLCNSRLLTINQRNNVFALAQSHHQQQYSKLFSSVISKGQDLLADSLSFGLKRKIVLDSYYPNTGIDVHGMLRFNKSSPVDAMSNNKNEEEEEKEKVNTLLMNSSILAFPHVCYLWKPSSAKEVTLESLSMVSLCKPLVEFLFIGCDSPLPPRELNRIKTEMRKKQIVVEQMNVMNAMGTFNVLNGEDRRIAVAIVV